MNNLDSIKINLWEIMYYYLSGMSEFVVPVTLLLGTIVLLYFFDKFIKSRK